MDQYGGEQLAIYHELLYQNDNLTIAKKPEIQRKKNGLLAQCSAKQTRL